jgi:hypothetical protein
MSRAPLPADDRGFRADGSWSTHVCVRCGDERLVGPGEVHPQTYDGWHAPGTWARPWCRWMPPARAAKIAYRESSKTKPRPEDARARPVVLLLWEAD